MKKSSGDIKLAVYYTPISAELNEKRLEQESPEAPDKDAPREDKSAKPAPLMDK